MTDEHVGRRRTRPLLVAVVLVVVLVVAVVVVAVVGGRGAVRASADVAVGGCVVVADRGNDAVAIDAVGCSGEGMTFYVAARTDGLSPCLAVTGSPQVAPTVRIGVDGDDALCLVPDLRQGRCYLLPSGDEGSPARRAAGHERKGCSTVAGAEDSPIYAVTRRVDGAARIECPAGQVSWGTERPRPIGLCLTPTRSP